MSPDARGITGFYCISTTDSIQCISKAILCTVNNYVNDISEGLNSFENKSK
jgi:hypothetical protein